MQNSFTVKLLLKRWATLMTISVMKVLYTHVSAKNKDWNKQSRKSEMMMSLCGKSRNGRKESTKTVKKDNVPFKCTLHSHFRD